MPRAALGIAVVRTSVGIAALLALGVATPSASAEPTAETKAVAEGLFQDGRELMEKGRTDEACAKFQESQRLVPKLGTLLNLATCHERQGKTASAWAEFNEAIALSERSGQKDRAAYATERAEALKSQLARLDIDVARAAPGAVVELDGNVVGPAALSAPIPVDPGEHRIEVRAPGHQSWTSTVMVAAGARSLRVEVPSLPRLRDGGPSNAAPPRTPSPAATTASPAGKGGGTTSRVMGVAALGLGAVGIGVGTVFGLQAIAGQNDSETHCEGIRCDQDGVDLREDARRSATISTIAFSVAAASIVGGIVLLVTAGSDEPAVATAFSVDAHGLRPRW